MAMVVAIAGSQRSLLQFVAPARLLVVHSPTLRLSYSCGLCLLSVLFRF